MASSPSRSAASHPLLDSRTRRFLLASFVPFFVPLLLLALPLLVPLLLPLLLFAVSFAFIHTPRFPTLPGLLSSSGKSDPSRRELLQRVQDAEEATVPLAVPEHGDDSVSSSSSSSSASPLPFVEEQQEGEKERGRRDVEAPNDFDSCSDIQAFHEEHEGVAEKQHVSSSLSSSSPLLSPVVKEQQEGKEGRGRDVEAPGDFESSPDIRAFHEVEHEGDAEKQHGDDSVSSSSSSSSASPSPVVEEQQEGEEGTGRKDFEVPDDFESSSETFHEVEQEVPDDFVSSSSSLSLVVEEQQEGEEGRGRRDVEAPDDLESSSDIQAFHEVEHEGDAKKPVAGDGEEWYAPREADLRSRIPFPQDDHDGVGKGEALHDHTQNFIADQDSNGQVPTEPTDSLLDQPLDGSIWEGKPDSGSNTVVDQHTGSSIWPGTEKQEAERRSHTSGTLEPRIQDNLVDGQHQPSRAQPQLVAGEEEDVHGRANEPEEVL